MKKKTVFDYVQYISRKIKMLIYSTKGSLGKENELVISQTGRGNTTSDKQFQKKI